MMPLRNKQYIYLDLSIDTNYANSHYEQRSEIILQCAKTLYLIVYFYILTMYSGVQRIIYKILESYKAPYLNSNIDFRLRYDFTR